MDEWVGESGLLDMSSNEFYDGTWPHLNRAGIQKPITDVTRLESSAYLGAGDDILDRFEGAICKVIAGKMWRKEQHAYRTRDDVDDSEDDKKPRKPVPKYCGWLVTLHPYGIQEGTALYDKHLELMVGLTGIDIRCFTEELDVDDPIWHRKYELQERFRQSVTASTPSEMAQRLWYSLIRMDFPLQMFNTFLEKSVAVPNHFSDNITIDYIVLGMHYLTTANVDKFRCNARLKNYYQKIIEFLVSDMPEWKRYKSSIGQIFPLDICGIIYAFAEIERTSSFIRSTFVV